MEKIKSDDGLNLEAEKGDHANHANEEADRRSQQKKWLPPTRVADDPSSDDPSSTTELILITLLLVHPHTQHFEILEVDFDASCARISDVLVQIAVSTKDEGLRTLSYSGVCDRHGCEIYGNDMLVDRCGSAKKPGSEIREMLLAIPRGMTGRKCVSLAERVLAIPDLATMAHSRFSTQTERPDKKITELELEGSAAANERLEVGEGVKEADNPPAPMEKHIDGAPHTVSPSAALARSGFGRDGKHEHSGSHYEACTVGNGSLDLPGKGAQARASCESGVGTSPVEAVPEGIPTISGAANDDDDNMSGNVPMSGRDSQDGFLPTATMEHKEDRKETDMKISHFAVHTVFCDGCRMYPILGRAHRCQDCKNYDLCHECVSSGVISEDHKVSHTLEERSSNESTADLGWNQLHVLMCRRDKDGLKADWTPEAVKTVQTLLKTHPNLVEEKDTQGMTPLHKAMSSDNTSIEVIKSIIKVYPQAAEKKDDEGKTPLRLAVSTENANTEIIKCVLEAYPQAAEQKDQRGWTHLHEGMYSKAPFEAIAAVYKAFPDAAKLVGEMDWGMRMTCSVTDDSEDDTEEKDTEGWMPLHCGLAGGASTDAIAAILQAHPKATKQRDEDGQLPLHLGMMGKAPADAVLAVLEEYPQGAAVKDKLGRTPLHCTSHCPVQADIVKAVLGAFRSAVKQEDYVGCTPLHSIMQGGASVDAVRTVLDAYPDAAKATAENGRLPLHYGLDGNSPAVAVQLVLDAYPEAAMMKDDKGMTPLHVGMQTGVSLDTIMPVLKACQDALKENDEEGKTPLHWAMAGDGTPADGIMAVLDTYPKAAEKKDKKGRIPLHAVFETHTMYGTASPTAAIKALLEACPQAAEMTDMMGRTPLFIGVEEGSPTLDVVEAILEASPSSPLIKDEKERRPLESKGEVLDDDEDATDKITAVLAACPMAAELIDSEEVEMAEARLVEITSPGMYYSCEKEEAEKRVEKAKSKKEARRRKTPLHWGTEFRVPCHVIKSILNTDPDAAEPRGEFGQTVLHDGMEFGAPLNVIEVILEAFPEATKMKDDRGRTPLHCGLTEKTFPDSISLVASAYPGAADIEDDSGLTPISYLVTKCSRATSFENIIKDGTVFQLRTLVPALRDARPLKRLCTVSNPVLLRVFFALFGDDSSMDAFLASFSDESDERELPPNYYELAATTSSDGEEAREEMMPVSAYANKEEVAYTTPSINLNHETIPGWTVLEILADLDTQDASNLLLQIVERNQDKLKMLAGTNNEVTIVCADENKTEVSFKSTEKITEETIREVADRAKLLNGTDAISKKCIRWGEEYGRFLKKYLIDRDATPQHISDTCVVVFGTETGEKKNEEFVALKFMRDDQAFLREIEKRQKISELQKREDLIRENILENPRPFVVSVTAAYSSQKRKEHLNTQLTEFSHTKVNFDFDLVTELEEYENIRRKSGDSYTQASLDYLLVMECGARVDLNDVIVHQNIAGRNVPKVLATAVEIAECLKFLNETCGVIHGDVKARNFVSLGVERGFAAIDLDNAAIKDEEYVGKKRTSTGDPTSSGYLPPEQAAVEEYFCKQKTVSRDDEETERAKEEIKQLQQKAEDLLRSQIDDTLKVASLQEVLLKKEEAERQLALLQNPPSPPPKVVASPQYDMWCFGVLLFQLCSSEQLFHMNTREEVDKKDLHLIKHWSTDSKKERLGRIGKNWPKILLEKLLQKEPVHRPKTWDDVIKDLKKYKTESRWHLETLEVIKKENAETRDTVRYEHSKTRDIIKSDLKALQSNVSNLMAQVTNVKCPYVFRFMSEEQFEEMKHRLQRETASDSVLDEASIVAERIQRAASLLDGFKKSSYETMLMLAAQHRHRFFCGTKNILYLSLLCGLTFKPIVTYKVSTYHYPEKVKKFAEASASLCNLGIKVATVWNAGATLSHFFGYPVPNFPPEKIEDIKNFLENINAESPVEGLRGKEQTGFNQEELDDFYEFLNDLEKHHRIRQFHNDTEKDSVREKTWKDAFFQKADDEKQVMTYVSKRESERIGGGSYTASNRH